MNRDEAKNRIVSTNVIKTFKESSIARIKIIDNIYNDFEKDIESIKKENIRLKKQLSKDHHIECSCSFCKPVGEDND